MGGFAGFSVMPAPLPQQEAFLQAFPQEAAPQPQQEAFLQAFPQETAPQPQEPYSPEISGQEMNFDPFAEIPPQPQTAVPTSPAAVPTSPDFNEFSPQPMVAPVPVPRPSVKGFVPQALPPPPTKESVRAANRMKVNPGNVAAVTLPPTTVTPTATISQPAPSNGKKIEDLHALKVRLVQSLKDCQNFQVHFFHHLTH